MTVCAAIASALSARAYLSFNGPYTDESDYLFVGSRLLRGETWPSHTYIFSSDIPLYVLGLGERLGGVVGARGVCALLGAISLVLYYDLLRVAGDSIRRAALATLLVAVSAPHVFVSKFATYDALCLAGAVAGGWAVSQALARKGAGAHVWMGLASLFFAFAFLSKYVIILELPIVGLFVLARRPRLAPALALPCSTVVAGYVALHARSLSILYETQVRGFHAPNAPRLALAATALTYSAPLLVLVALAFALDRVRAPGAAAAPARMSGFGWCLLLALPMAAYHLYAQDRISMYKHMVYATLALAPLAAAALDTLAETSVGSLAWLSPILLAAIVVDARVRVRDMERSYPDNRHVSAALDAASVSSDFSILSEDPFLFRYAMGANVDAARFFEPQWFDNDRNGTHTPGDVLAAVWEGKFAYVYVDGASTSALTSKLRARIFAHKYTRVFAEPYETSGVIDYVRSGTMELYRRNEPYTGSWPVVAPPWRGAPQP